MEKIGVVLSVKFAQCRGDGAIEIFESFKKFEKFELESWQGNYSFNLAVL